MSIWLLPLVRTVVTLVRHVYRRSSVWLVRPGRPLRYFRRLQVFMSSLCARSLIGFVTCIGFRVAPQVILVTSPGLSCFYFGSLTVAVCLPLRLTASGCVWVSMRMPQVVSLRRTRFFVRSVGRFRFYFALAIWCPALRFLLAARRLPLGLGLSFPGSRGALGCLWWSGVTCPFSSLLCARCLRCVSPPCGRRFSGLMARNPASYVSCLTLTWDEWARVFQPPVLFQKTISIFGGVIVSTLIHFQRPNEVRHQSNSRHWLMPYDIIMLLEKKVIYWAAGMHLFILR